MPRRIGIFGGSFNPIHLGHIALARQMLRQAGLDEVWFLITPLNPFKTAATDLLDDARRLEIAERSLQQEPHMRASGYEFHLPKPSYTWHTLQCLSRDYPDCHFSLLIGADNWVEFDRWARPDYILSHYPVYVYPREGYPVDAQQLPQGVKLLRTELYPVSSTAIRQRVLAHQSIAGLVTEEARPLIEKYYAKS